MILYNIAWYQKAQAGADPGPQAYMSLFNII